ncbi:hypothetical protein [Vibrio mediterranei]|uniref:hypothetical protein n=1 Tax=Vibrio mediterranei TaxID=689 RepID=UPI00148C2459|nr:hypothetical protein [Vibrio mediterranei]
MSKGHDDGSPCPTDSATEVTLSTDLKALRHPLRKMRRLRLCERFVTTIEPSV